MYDINEEKINGENAYYSLVGIGTSILSHYKKLADLEIKDQTSSQEYEKVIKNIKTLTKFEDYYYGLLIDPKFNVEFQAFLATKCTQREFDNYTAGYYKLFHEFSDEELVKLRIYSKIIENMKIEAVLSSGITGLDKAVEYILERKNKMFIDLINEDAENPQYKEIRKMIVKAKYDNAFILKKKDLVYDADENMLEALGVGNDIEEVATLGKKMSKLSEKSINANVRSILLNIAYIKSCLAQFPDNLVEQIKERFNDMLESGEISDTPGFQLFIDTLDQVSETKKRHITDNMKLKRKY